MDESVLDRLIREAEGAGSDAPPPPPATSSSEVVAAGASPLAALTGNPALLSMLPALLGGASGGKASLPAFRGHPDRHTALLCAIKPYLGSERQQTAQRLIELCRLWSTVQGMGLPGLLTAGHGASASSGEGSAEGKAEAVPVSAKGE